MKSKLVAVAVLFAVATMLSPDVPAQSSVADATDMQALRAAVRSDKRALVAETLRLSDAEASKFWPIYEAYQRDLQMANRMRARAVEGVVLLDKPISDVYAKSLTNDLIVGDELELKARRKLHDRLMKPLPGRRVMPAAEAARYLQLEGKIRALLAYDLATAIPLVKTK